MLSLLRKKATEYAGRHSDDHRAPTGTECIVCDRTEPGTHEQPVTLALCSICQQWRCSTCYSQHKAPKAWYEAAPRQAWWKRVVGRG